MNAQLWRELNEALQHLEDDTSVQAVVLQSTLARGEDTHQAHADSR